MTRDQKLITATFFLGLIPLTVGLSIFLFWWMGKAWFLTTYHKLENWGLLWILISFPLGIAGLTTGIVYLSKRYKTDLKKGLFGLLCVVINIPVLIWILDTQGDIEQRAYVRVYNNSGSDFRSLIIRNSLHTEQFTFLQNNDYQTGYFYPNYDEWESNAPDIEEVSLLIETDKEQKRMNIPVIYKGECLTLSIDQEFNIKLKGRWND